MEWMFALNDPTDELSAPWGVNEQLRRLLNVAELKAPRTEKMILGGYLVAAAVGGTRAGR